ncbi:MAG: ABC transporter permease [Phycisphaerae bacterium]
MRKLIVVAFREYLAAVRSRAFIISLVLMPIMMGGALAIQMLLKDKVDVTDKRIAVVDRVGFIYDALADAATRRNRDDIFRGEGPTRTQVEPRFLLERVDTAPEDGDAGDSDAHRDDSILFDLSERVRSRDLFAFLVIDAEPDATGSDDDIAGVPPLRIVYHSNSPTYRDAPRFLTDAIYTHVQALRFKELNLDPALVARATQRLVLDQRGLVTRDEAGHIQAAKRANPAAGMLLPMGLMMLMFMMVMLGAQPLIHSVLEEKMQRIAEVLLASIPPFPLMMGKLLGMVAVSLTMLTLYLGGAAYAIHRAGFGHLFPGHLIVWFVIYQSLAILMFGSLFAAIGAAVTDMKEAQSLVTPVMLVVVAPLFVWFNVVREPNATMSVAMSLFPPATPMLMIMRQCTPAGVPVWQPILGVVLVLITTGACVFAAGRIFRVGILMQGKGAKLGDMLRWVISG